VYLRYAKVLLQFKKPREALLLLLLCCCCSCGASAAALLLLLLLQPAALLLLLLSSGMAWHALEKLFKHSNSFVCFYLAIIILTNSS
jgi:hypothetical protein